MIHKINLARSMRTDYINPSAFTTRTRVTNKKLLLLKDSLITICKYQNKIIYKYIKQMHQKQAVAH